MKLWRVDRDHRYVGYDEFDAWIISHETKQGALDCSGYAHEKGISAEEVGIAVEGMPADTIVLGSFNAG